MYMYIRTHTYSRSHHRLGVPSPQRALVPAGLRGVGRVLLTEMLVRIALQGAACPVSMGG